MKNIHILPTDKPSSLCLDSKDKLWFAPNSGYIIADGKQNIYITNSEEIKKGDWCMSLCDDESYEEIYQCKNIGLVDDEDKKIILTTDQDLDGIQAIDDEFLEWFVKNPSGESVEIEEKYRKCCRNTDGKNENCIEPINCEGWLSEKHERPYKTTCDKRFEGYKIIIPKEEPKKEQDKDKYSEEEVFRLTLDALDLGMRIRQDQLSGHSQESGKELHKEWFEQFKNK